MQNVSKYMTTHGQKQNVGRRGGGRPGGGRQGGGRPGGRAAAGRAAGRAAGPAAGPATENKMKAKVHKQKGDLGPWRKNMTGPLQSCFRAFPVGSQLLFFLFSFRSLVCLPARFARGSRRASLAVASRTSANLRSALNYRGPLGGGGVC